MPIFSINNRGFALTFGAKVHSQKFENKFSRGLMFAEPAFSRHLLFCFFITYDTEEKVSTETSANEGSGPNREFFKLFVSRKFPFVSLRNQEGKTYKVLNFKLSWIKGNKDYGLFVRNKTTDELHEYCNVMVLDKTVGEKSLDSLNSEKLQEVSRMEFADAKNAVGGYLFPLVNGRLSQESDQIALLKIFAALGVNGPHILRTQLLLSESNPSLEPELSESINQLLSPLFLGPHDISQRLSSISDEQLYSSLSELMLFLKEIGVEAFLNSGTLLGAARNGDMIQHDDDLDLAICIPGESTEEIVQNWREIRRKFRSRYATIDKGCFFSIDLFDGVEMDMFPSWSKEGRAYIFPYCFGDVSIDTIHPLTKIMLRNELYPAPNEVEKVLQVNYGPNWRIPDPNWRFPWGKYSKKFREIEELMMEGRG